MRGTGGIPLGGCFTLTSNNQEVAHRFGHGLRAIAGSELCLRFLEMAADSFLAQVKRLGDLWQ